LEKSWHFLPHKFLGEKPCIGMQISEILLVSHRGMTQLAGFLVVG
jgi:hypothetical protein